MAEDYRNRKYVAKDFDTFRSLLFNYAQTYYPDKITDFSESSMGGVFLDFASYVGDVLSFYMDHQYAELNPETAVEQINIERLIRNSGIKITGATPSIVTCQIMVKVGRNLLGAEEQEKPIIKQGSIFKSRSGVLFRLLEDVDFRLIAGTRTSNISDENEQFVYLVREAKCMSGTEITETFDIGSFTKFKTITLSNPDITKILSVSDSNGNDYYEVNSLTEEVVFKNLKIKDNNRDEREILRVLPAPYRYITETALLDRTTTLTFGGGTALNFEDDVIPDPSEFALTLYGTETYSRDLLNPVNFINKRTLGVIDENIQLTVKYMHGGGLAHNVLANNIDGVQLLLIEFPENPPQRVINRVRNTVEVFNIEPAKGGADRISTDIYKSLITSTRNSQMRIVTKQDLIARVYTMPSNFGRVFKANVLKDPYNSLISNLYIICKNSENNLVTATEYLKNNLITSIENYRMISDTIEILDSKIINFRVTTAIVTDPFFKRNKVIEDVKLNIANLLNVYNFEIDQPINLSDIRSKIYSTPGVLTVTFLDVYNVSNTLNNLSYSENIHDFEKNRINDMIFPPIGGIFELKYKDKDIDIPANT